MSLFTRLLTLLSLFFSLSLQAQDLTTDTLEARKILNALPENNKEKTKALEKVVTLYQKHNLPAPVFHVKLLLEESRSYSDYEEALASRQTLLKELKTTLSGDQQKLAKAHYLIGGTYNEMGKFPLAITQFKTADSIYTQISPEPLLSRFKIYMALTNAYSRLGDNERTAAYLELAEQYANKITSTPSPKITVLENKAYLAYNSPQALSWMDEAIRLSTKEYGQLHPNTFQAIHIKASVYYRQKKSAQAVETLKRLIPLQIQYYKKNNLKLAQTYQDIGAFYKDWAAPESLTAKESVKYRQKYTQLAIDYHLKAAEIYEENTGGIGTNVSHLYRNLGFIYLYRDKGWDAALLSFHKALLAVLPNEKTDDPLKLINFEGNETLCLDLILAFRALRGKSQVLQAMYKNEIKIDTVASLLKPTLDLMEQIVETYARNLTDDAQVNTFAMKEILLNVANNLRNNYFADKPTAEFTQLIHQLLEKNKNSLLLSNLQTDEASQSGLLDNDLLDEETDLKKEMAKVKKGLLEAMNDKDSAKIVEQKEKLLATQSTYETFIQKIEKEDPKYYELKYQQNIPNLKTIQNLLDEKTVILEYYIKNNRMRILQIASDTSIFKIIRIKQRRNKGEKISRGKLFTKHFEELRKSLTNVQQLEKDPEGLYNNFCEHSYGMYKMLEIDSFLHRDNIEHLIIIPSERLNYIPFEVLLRQQPDTGEINYAQLPYLMKDFRISYAYSTSLLYQNLKQQVNGGGRMLAFAASYQQEEVPSSVNRSGNLEQLRSSLSDLPGAKAEVEALQALYSGQFFLGLQANEARFKQLATKQPHSIIHLAMHGLLNKDYPFASSLAFTENGDSLEDNFVFAHELSQMDIQANLVVLSACETGYGKFEYGEGVASIARAFMFAGTPSMVMTLWEVNDYSTSKIMGYFYEFLYEGMDKAEALRQAKLKYLEESGDAAQHPFFWAPFVQLGNYEPVQLHKKSDNYLFWGLTGGGVGLLALVGGVAYRRRKKKAA